MKTETKKTDFDKIKKFEKWIEKIQNVHRGNIQKMGDAYERLLINSDYEIA